MSFFKELKRRNVVRVGIAYTVATWLLIQVTDTVFPRIGLPDSAVTLVIALLAIGFIPALIFAWAFEMTPDGIKREKDVDRTQSITPETGKNLNRLIIAGLVLVIIVMGVERAWFAGNDEVEERQTKAVSSAVAEPAKSIAVLPFADMSQGGDQAWFADGLAEEILNALVRAPDLLVSSRTSSFAYKDTSTPVAQIADELGVEHVLEGSVRRAGDRIRVTAQLIRASDGFHVWSENYDRNADDVIAIQEELAISIAKALKTTMDPDRLAEMLRAGTRSVAAYEHYLNGLSIANEASVNSEFERLLGAYNEFERAREIDPQFSAAHGKAAGFWRGQLSISQRGANLTDLSPAEIQTLFLVRINLAIESADNDIDRKRHKIMKALVDLRVREGIRLAREALNANPYDSDVLTELVDLAVWAKDTEAENFALDHAYSLWEHGAQWANAYITTAWRVTQSRPLAEFVSKVLARYPGNKGLIYQAHRGLLWQGEFEMARKLVSDLKNENPRSLSIVQTRQACADGRRSEAERILRSVVPTLSKGDQASSKWHMLQALSRHEEAHEQLRPWASAEVPLPVAAYMIYPDFDPSYFPFVQEIIRREGIKRPPPREIPFACPEQDVIEQESVAVLPFKAMSSGEDDGYFADGLTEEILNSLARLPELLVTARTSSFHFKGKNLPIPEIAATLGVNHVVEGSVRRSGERVRITAQLIRAEDGFHLWSDTYDRTLEDVFSVQENIAENIAETLDVVLNEDKRQQMRDARIDDVEAFIAYQKGMEMSSRAHSISDPIELLPEANVYFDQVLAINPEITNAQLERTDLFGHIIYNNAIGRSTSTQAELEAALEEILAGLSNAARYAPSDAQRAYFEAERAEFTDDWSGIQAKFDRAFQTEECYAVNWAQSLAGVFGRAEQVSAHYQRLMRCDPLSDVHLARGSQFMVWAGQAEDVITLNTNHLNKAGFNARIDDTRFVALLATGKYRDDPGMYDANPEGSFYDVPRRMFAYAADNDITKAREIFETSKKESAFNDMNLLLAEVALGNREAANAYANKMDARFASPFILAETVKACFCGAPFDLKATPNFKARIEEAGFDWPPISPIKYPAKDW
jgi:TolB-like protein